MDIKRSPVYFEEFPTHGSIYAASGQDALNTGATLGHAAQGRSGRTEAGAGAEATDSSHSFIGQNYAQHGMHLSTPRRDDADGDGDYDYDLANYGANGGNYNEDDSASMPVRGRNKNGQEEHMTHISHPTRSNNSSNSTVKNSTAHSVSSASSSNGYAPPTPGAGNAYSYNGGSSATSGYRHSSSELPDSTADDDGSPTEPSKKKQKRNKPTLSCSECVERKTKVRSSSHYMFTCSSPSKLTQVLPV